MISTLKKILFHQDGQGHLRTPQDETAEFLLRYRNLDVGHLSLRGGKWHFEYTDTFREKKDAYPIINFPHLDKHYESDVLWPFFVIRIPGLGQPAVQRVIREENLDPSNEVQLLKRFGKTTIANPFTLIPKDALAEPED
ncbi:MAG: HipA N-terminal domain-containing protein [Gemmatimonadota bacterium]|nr:HipA N-terminal domain-containing protein [Gemmatimonadota bacterium]